MLFKTVDGTCVEIVRSHYLTDTAYYTAIMKVKGYYAKVGDFPPQNINVSTRS